MNREKPISKAVGIGYHRKEAKGGDWYGEDGLLRCGKCNAPKESVYQCVDGNYFVVGVMCRCEEGIFGDR